MNKITIILVICCFIFFPDVMAAKINSNIATPVIHWREYSTDIFQQAKKENKQILLLGKAEWCQWCLKMRETTLNNPAIIQSINANFIPVQIDIDKNINDAKQYQIVDLPTIIILNSDNQIIKQLTGYIEPIIIFPVFPT